MLISCGSAPQYVTKLEAVPVALSNCWGLISSAGETQPLSVPGKPSAVVNNMFYVADSTGYCRLYNVNDPRQPVSPKQFARIGYFFEEVAPAQEEAEAPFILINKQGETVATLDQQGRNEIVLLHNFNDGRALVYTRGGKYGYINTKGEIVIPAIYDQAYDFSEGRALVGNANRENEMAFHLIDTKGNMQLSIQLENCMLGTRLANGLLAYKPIASGQCCYMSAKGNPVLYLPNTIKETLSFHHQVATVYTERGMGLVNVKGQIIIPPTYEKGHVLSENRVALRKNGNWRVCDFEENTLVMNRYDSVLIAQDRELPILQRIAPQQFIRKREEVTEPPVTLQKGKKVPVQQPTPKTVENRADWKTISKENPFFDEAAKVINGNLLEEDRANRAVILNYVEHFRTSYTTKDIDFLEQLFSENALIIVGKVIESKRQASGYLPAKQVEYNVKSKRNYLDRLCEVFNANKKIDVRFSNFHITKHPTQKGIYGVGLHQSYASDLYSDEGYLFLLWDFRDETAPQIHVRTWQPAMIDGHTPLPSNEVFTIGNFNLQ